LNKVLKKRKQTKGVWEHSAEGNIWMQVTGSTKRNVIKITRISVMKSRNTRQEGTCSTYRGNGYKTLIGKPEGKRSFQRPRRRWKNNIKMVFNIRVCGG
jgi:hypothetical protein